MSELKYTLEYTWIKTGPRWWQLRWRYVNWRFRRLIAREDAKLTPEALELRNEMRREMDRSFFFGDPLAASRERRPLTLENSAHDPVDENGEPI